MATIEDFQKDPVMTAETWFDRGFTALDNPVHDIATPFQPALKGGEEDAFFANNDAFCNDNVEDNAVLADNVEGNDGRSDDSDTSDAESVDIIINIPETLQSTWGSSTDATTTNTESTDGWMDPPADAHGWEGWDCSPTWGDPDFQ